MKKKVKFLLIISLVLILICTLFIGFIAYGLSQLFSPTPLPAHGYATNQKDFLSACTKVQNHYSLIFSAQPQQTATLNFTRGEFNSLLQLTSQFITARLNKKLDTPQNRFYLFYEGKQYRLHFSYYYPTPLPFGNFINLDCSFNFSIKDEQNNLKVLKAKAGDLPLPSSTTQSQVEHYFLLPAQTSQTIKVIKNLSWQNDVLEVTYYPHKILKLLLNYSQLMNNNNDSQPDIQQLLNSNQ